MEASVSTSTVSVIVPALDAATTIKACLFALKVDDASNGEIIVVDDASTDNTAETARAMGARVFSLEKRSGPSMARNFGAAQATGAYLFFVDSDVIVRPGAIARIRDFLDRNPSIAAVFGSYDDEPAAEGTIAKYRNLLHHHVHQMGKAEASTFWAGCGAIRKDLFESLGGFDPCSYPRCIEDIELGYRLVDAGHSIRLDHDLLCTHLKKWTFSAWIKTDIFCRAIPWSRLNLERSRSPDDLNIRRSQKLSVALVGASCLCLPVVFLSRWFLAAAAAACIAALLLNLRLFSFFFRKGGIKFVLKCIPLHLLYFLYSGLSYLYVWAAWKLHLRVRDWNDQTGVRS
jgi:glycosyltransferase involved in cell wall biosynthesis